VCERERGRRREEGGDESLPLFARRVDLCSWLVGLALDSSLTLHTNPESRNRIESLIGPLPLSRWVRMADEDTPEESVVGDTSETRVRSTSALASPGGLGGGEAPDDKPEEGEDDAGEGEEDEKGGEEAGGKKGPAAEDSKKEDVAGKFKPPVNNEGASPKKKAAPKSPSPQRSPSPDPQFNQAGGAVPMRHQLKSAVSTETYDVDCGKYKDFTKALNDKKYPIKYSNVRRKAPRVTTLSTDNSDNRAPDCLRESYNWTAVGKYKAMTDQTGSIGQSKSGTFKKAQVYPRFSENSAEADLKKLFKEQMKLREKEKIDGSVPLQERIPARRKALEDALTQDDKPSDQPLPR